MTGWVILVDQLRDFPNAETPHKVITTSDYLARPLNYWKVNGTQWALPFAVSAPIELKAEDFD